MMDSAGRAIRSPLIGDAGKTLLERTMGFVVMTAGTFALGDYFLPLSIVSGDSKETSWHQRPPQCIGMGSHGSEAYPR